MSKPKKNAKSNAAAVLKLARDLVDKQAEDPGLWFITETISEAYLQQELRKLHALIEEGTNV